MKKILIGLMLFSAGQAGAQVTTDSAAIQAIRRTVNFLADDKLEGRRTGTAGEKLAYGYIVKAFKSIGLTALPQLPDYLQAFEVKEGRKYQDASMKLNGEVLAVGKDFVPMAYAADADNVFVEEEKESVTFYYSVQKQINLNKDNPHFDLKASIRSAAEDAAHKGLKAIFVIASDSMFQELGFDKNEKSPRLTVPVILVHETAFTRSMANPVGNFQYRINWRITESSRTGHNVAGYLNNGAVHTVVIGAHYDHLGYGEDHNSLYAGAAPMIHNGADDNASGTAALIELAGMLKKSATKEFNYLFVAFSGEELGLYGSKYFVEHAPIKLTDINYMINMDMVGRLNDSTRAITIGGYGTSPAWGKIISTESMGLRIKTDSAGSGPSDHTSFYRKDIPVLFFFTGTHSDYHKPSDDADKINVSGTWLIVKYIQQIIAQTSGYGKLAFSKTREAATGKSSFKVTMGIMPDYTFSGEGVLVDGVSDGRPAKAAGVLAGDVILQLGEHKVTDVQTYMQALNKFSKGEKTTVKLKRGKETISYDLVF